MLDKTDIFQYRTDVIGMLCFGSFAIAILGFAWFSAAGFLQSADKFCFTVLLLAASGFCGWIAWALGTDAKMLEQVAAKKTTGKKAVSDVQ